MENSREHLAKAGCFSSEEKMKFYESRKWKKKREHILRRDSYQCQESKRYGKYAEATTVHHIYPLEEYPELALMDWNLISMSAAQHDRMHDRKTDKVTNLGLYWQRKRRREFEAWKKSICMKYDGKEK